jgi:DegV family protein with EDD domain
MPVAVVSDSTAYLPADLVAEFGIAVVPLVVVVGGDANQDNEEELAPEDIARVLGARRVDVSTSRPAPARFADEYGNLLAAGADAVVSVHLSARLSGTYDSAVLAAKEFGDRVSVVDSRSTGMGLGFPVLAAARAAADGADAAGVRAAALACVERTSTYFYVDTLEFLRRGGRIGAASALVGTALSVKPILHVVDGQLVLAEKVRTASRALARLVDMAATAAGDSDVDIAVHHLIAAERAQELESALTERLGGRLRHSYVTEIGAAIAAHVGPGVASVVVSRVK